MKRNFKKLAVFLAVMLITLSFASNGFAANTVANLKATYRNIVVYKNGILFNFSKEPFIVDGTTYVPLRDMAEMLDKEVTWDGVNYKIGVNDKPGQSSQELYQQIFSLQQQVTKLQDENKKLKEQKDSTIDLDDLEDDLNDDYDEIGDVTVEDIILDGDEDDIEVEIYINTKKTAQYNAWKDLDDDDIEDFLQDIVDDILDEYEDADITGFIEDEYDDKKVEKFTISSKGKVSLGGSSKSGGDLDDLEEDLNDDYDDIEGIDIEDIILDGDEDDIEVEIYVDLEDDDDYDDWKDLEDDEIEDFLQDIVDDILDEFEDADITGFIEDEYDGSELEEFSVDSDGYVELD